MDERDFGHYVAGYVDGEGCFCVSLNPRPKLTIGWEIRPSFSVSQNFDRAEVLCRIRDRFQCGTIRRDSGSRTLKFEIRSLPDLIAVVIPFFERYPLLSAKQHDFFRFRDICTLMASGIHRTQSGLEQILPLIRQMNPSGTRKYSLVLEDIVSATRNSG